MSDFLMLKRHSIPCWYDLSFDEKNVALIVKVHQEFLPTMALVNQSYHVAQLAKDFHLGSFEGDFSKEQVGFEQSFTNIGKEGDFLQFSAMIPALEKFRMIMCPDCQGHAKNLIFGGECVACDGAGIVKATRPCRSCEGNNEEGSFSRMDDCSFCQGTGKEFDSVIDWQPFYPICSTLMVWLDILEFGTSNDKLTSCKFPQLLTVTPYIDREMRSAPLSGVYSGTLVNLLQRTAVDLLNNEKKDLPSLFEAMQKAWNKIHGQCNALDKMNTWAIVRKDGWMSIGCPGDRTGLISENHGGPAGFGEGYGFYSHNLDDCAQQLTLLCALAALCDGARKEINS